MSWRQNNEEQEGSNDLNEVDPDDTIKQPGDRDPALPESKSKISPKKKWSASKKD